MPYKDRRKRYEANERCRAKKPEKYKLLHRNNTRRACRKGYYIKKRYGLTVEGYESLQQEQNDSCAICKKPSGLTKAGRCNLHVDYDHTTGKVRGLVCARCNTLVGFLTTTSDSVMAEARRYIEKNS